MNKIPSLFVRSFEGQDCTLTGEVTPGCEWVLEGKGTPTEKYDGTACLVRNEAIYARYDRKKNRKTGSWKPEPDGWIACQQSGIHWPGWKPVREEPEYQWHREAFAFWSGEAGSYELVGPKVQGNPYGLMDSHQLWRHGGITLFDLPSPPTVESLESYLEDHYIEGIVWHHSEHGMVKLKASDFNLVWPNDPPKVL